MTVGGVAGNQSLELRGLDRLADGRGQCLLSGLGELASAQVGSGSAHVLEDAARRTGQAGSWGHITDRGEKQPWSRPLSWKKDMSNSSAIRERPTCRASAECPAA